MNINAFKTRLGNHKKSFNHRNYSTETCLSEYIWELKDKGVEYDLSWKIIDRGKPYNPINKMCGLCNMEKYYINYKPEMATINKRDELNKTCRHKLKCLLVKNSSPMGCGNK